MLSKSIKANAATRDIPLVLITSAPHRGDKRRFEALGFAGYLNKPLANWQLRDAIGVIVQSRRSGKAVPMITQHSLRESKQAQHKQTMENVSFAHAHILLVEDNPVNQLVAATMLQKYNCSVTTAGDGEEAVKLVKERSFQLILMDCQMPVLDGYEATQAIRKFEANNKRARTPIIALTANAMRGDRERCLASGMDDYIAKPVRQNELEQALLKWLNEHQPFTPHITKPLPVDKSGVLDVAMFDMLSELMGDALKGILSRHLETATGYIATIETALKEQDFNKLAMAAHPLKSSSQQIGALNVAKAAGELERMAREASPNILMMRPFVRQLSQLQADAAAAIKARMQL
jgi:CheY-like chemotaxis protein/HPt (histidine-containing phosphotransfer) domain-containing protein